MTRLHRVATEFTHQNPMAGIESSELQYCCNHVVETLQGHLKEVLTAELLRHLDEGTLYGGKKGEALRESISTHFRTPHPLRVSVNDQGVLIVSLSVPEVIDGPFEATIEELRHKLAPAGQVLRARGHDISVYHDEESKTFSVNLWLQNAIAQPQEESVDYCRRQHERVIGDEDHQELLSEGTLLALPRYRAGQRDGHYRFSIEAGALPLIGETPTLDALLRKIDRLAADMPEFDRIGIHADAGQLDREELVDHYREAGPVELQLFSADIDRMSVLDSPVGFDHQQLIEWVSSISSDPYADMIMQSRPFVVSSPFTAGAPAGKVVMTDEAVIASSSVRKNLQALVKAGNLRLSLSRGFFSEYHGSTPRVELIESVLEELVETLDGVPAGEYGGASIDWFSGIHMNGVGAYQSGVLLRLYNTEGKVVAHGIADGHSRDDRVMHPVDNELLERADRSIERITSLPPNGNTNVRMFSSELEQAGLEFDDFFLYSIGWHLRNETLQSSGLPLSPTELTRRIMRLPHITAIEDRELIEFRRFDPRQDNAE
jgi:hypothetical protein